MSLENGILGYLSMKPLSGYDIKKLFDMSAAYFWPADQAQIYRSLKKLMEEGLIELKERESGKTLERKVYAITVKGRETLQEWLMDTGESDLIARASYTIQLFFSGTLSREDQLEFLNAQLKANNALLQKLWDKYNSYGKVVAETAGISTNDRQFESAIYACRWGIARGEAYSKLITDIIAEISCGQA